MIDPEHEFDNLSLSLETQFAEIQDAQTSNTRLALDAAWGLVPQVRGNTIALLVLTFFVVVDPDWSWWVKGIAIIVAIHFFDLYERRRIGVQRKADLELWQLNSDAVKPWETHYNPPFLRD